MQNPIRILPHFMRQQSGNVAILFGLSLIPILLGIGCAIDFGRALLVKESMQGATDAAALAIASWPNLDDAQAKTKAQQFFNADYAPTEVGTVKNVDVTFTDSDVTVTAAGSAPTSLMKIAGFDLMDVSVSSTVKRRANKIELVLVLQAGESMSDGKIDALKDATKNMVQTLFENKFSKESLKIGVVPFSGAVNIGGDNLNSGWIDTKGHSTISREDFKPGTNVLDLYDNIRIENGKDAYENVVELSSFPMTHRHQPTANFSAYFAPDEPDTSSNYVNNYAPDIVTGSPDKRQRDTAKYQNLTVPDSSSGKGPDFNCPFRAVTALTKIQGQVISGVEDIKPAGSSTVIPAGLLWGWRLLSPEEPFTDDVAYSDKQWTKVVLLLSDGQNDVGGGGNGHNNSSYNAFGFAQSGHLGSTTGSETIKALDSKTLVVCESIKEKGILVYTVGFGASSAGQTLLKTCATKSDMYYNAPSKYDLSDIFQSVALDLSEVRLAQ